MERGAGLLKEAGISISIGFVVGLPGETQETVNKTIALCNRVKPDRVQFTRFTPIPGSAIANQYQLDAWVDFTIGLDQIRLNNGSSSATRRANIKRLCKFLRPGLRTTMHFVVHLSMLLT